MTHIPVDTNPNPVAVTLETERCILRELTLEDANALFALASSPQVSAYSSMFLTVHVSVDETYNFALERLDKYKQGIVIPWVIIEKSTQRVIGFTQLFDYRPDHRRADIAYSLVPEYWGRGIGTEIAKAVISYSFTHLQLLRLQAVCDPCNMPSIRIIEKCGFHYEGLLRSYYLVLGERSNRNMYSMLDDEFWQLYQKQN